MVALIVFYIIGVIVAATIGLAQVSMNLDWEDRVFARARERERQDLLEGWRTMKFSWAWPLLIVSPFKSLARRARRAAATQAQGEQCRK